MPTFAVSFVCFGTGYSDANDEGIRFRCLSADKTIQRRSYSRSAEKEPYNDRRRVICEFQAMGRPKRAAQGGLLYHVLNRANARLPIFETSADYEAFERILEEGVARMPMRLLSYCLTPNHWLFLL